MKKKNQLLAALAVGLIAGPLVAQAQYKYEVFDHPDADGIQVFGINDRGDVVGNVTDEVGGVPFVYASKKGTVTDVAPSAGHSDTGVLASNDAGVMVGSVLDLTETMTSGFIRDKQGNYTIVDHPLGVGFTQFRGVNNKGLVTGFRGDASVNTIGFIYDPKSNTFTDLNPTSWFTIAQGINSKGEVVGSSNFTPETDPCPGLGNPFLRYGWLRATDGTVTYFEVNGSHSSGRGINDQGSIVGFFIDLTDGNFKGYKAELDGTQCQSLTLGPSDILDVPGTNETIAAGINNAGDISGGTSFGDTSIGFIARPN